MDQNHYLGHNIAINDLIGNFGLYHLNMMVFTMIRNVVFAIDTFALSLSLISTKDANITCKESFGVNMTGVHFPAGVDPKCFYMDLASNNTIRPCEEWTFLDPKQRDTYTAQWGLVCQREWLASTTTTIYMLGVFVNTCIWGYFGDKFGRWTSHSITHMLIIPLGIATLFAPTIFWFMFFRGCVAFCCISYTVLNTLQIEMIGPKYRSYTNYPGHIGYGLGVLLLAFIGVATNNWRYLVSIAPVTMAITAPWLLYLPESIRWLTVQGKWEKARKEIRYAARLNSIPRGSNFDSEIDQYFTCARGENNQERPTASFLDLFRHQTYCLNLISVWSSLFLVSCIYMIRTLNYDEDSVSQMANFIISGAGEWLCIVLAGGLMHLFKRKTCLIIFVGLSGLTHLLDVILRQTSHILIDSKFLAYTLDGVAKSASTSGYIVIYLVAIELFPTELRSVAQSLVLTASSVGGVMGPLQDLILGDQLICSVVLAVLTFLIVLSLKFFVTETKHVQLADTIKR